MVTSRVVFGNHAAGYIFPMLLCVKPLEDSFAFMMQKLASTDNFILLSSSTLTVCAGSQESLAMMGVRVRPPLLCRLPPHRACSSALPAFVYVWLT